MKDSHTALANRYVSCVGRLEPNKEHQNLMRNKDGTVTYRKMKWREPIRDKHTRRSGDGIRLNVFREFVRTDKTTRNKFGGYYINALGISRPTYYRWRSRVIGETSAVMDDHSQGS